MLFYVVACAEQAPPSDSAMRGYRDGATRDAATVADDNAHMAIRPRVYDACPASKDAQ